MDSNATQSREHVDVFRDKAGEWRWRRQADNGEIVSTSGESYTRRSTAITMATHVNPDILLRIEER